MMSVCDDGWDIFRAGGLIDRRMRGVLTLILGPRAMDISVIKEAKVWYPTVGRLSPLPLLTSTTDMYLGVPTISAAGGLMDDWLS